MISLLRRKCVLTPLSNNVSVHGTGALNVDACRVPFVSKEDERESKEKNQHSDFGTHPLTGNIIYGDYSMIQPINYNPPGRWPSNVILISAEPRAYHLRYFKQAETAMELKEYMRKLVTPGPEQGVEGVFVDADGDYDWTQHDDSSVHGILLSDSTSASLSAALRVLKPGGHLLLATEGTGHQGVCLAEDMGFEVRDCIFVADSESDKLHYVPKAGKKEREEGLDDLPEKAGSKRKNTHPTVKPVKVMERLLSDVPEGSVVLDPFMGSGTTGVAAGKKFKFVGVEKEEEYFRIAEARLKDEAK